jgi:glutamate/tyrosine decarboxylase-like PLP-dependent enzyme
MSDLHAHDAELVRACLAWIEDRLRHGAPLGAPTTSADLRSALGGSSSITADGLGSSEAWRRFAEVLAPANLGLDNERFLAFIPAAPSPAAALLDAVVSVATFSGESSLEAAGAVYAENEALGHLAALAGFPPGAGGCFVSGGSVGNLSALAVARDHRRGRSLVAAADTAHSSIANALRLLQMDPVVVATDERGRLTGDALRAAIEGRPEVGTVVASAGSTNAGVVDELDAIADVCARSGAWLHVDGAYGGAALFAPDLRPLLTGLDRADSFIVDPHKWLFSPLGSCALLYRDPAQARAVHTQSASYLDSLHDDADGWNPADHGFHLTRRASGVPFWFTLAAHGTTAIGASVQRAATLARYAADRLRAAGPPVELVLEPQLSVVLFRRAGWGEREWAAWSRDLLADGTAFVAPSRWRGEAVGRLVFLHPNTPESLVDELVASLR